LKQFSPALAVLLALVASSLVASPNRQPVTERPAAEFRESDWKRAFEWLEKGDRRAIDFFRRAFAVEEDKQLKQQAAAMLVVLQDKDPQYYAYLEGFAQAIVQRDAPFPLQISKDGEVVPGVYSLRFLNWCLTHELDPKTAVHQSIYTDPSDLFFLGQTGDPRSFDLMLQALDADNHFVAVRAASSLAYVGDRSAIDPIIELSKRLPTGVSLFVAEALLHFDDPKALAAAREMVSADILAELLRSVDRDRQRRHADRQLLRKLTATIAGVP